MKITVLDKERRWQTLGKGYWTGRIVYDRKRDFAVRWSTYGGKVEIATTGHGGIDPDTAAAYSDALLLAIAEAKSALTTPGGE